MKGIMGEFIDEADRRYECKKTPYERELFLFYVPVTSLLDSRSSV